MFPSSSGVLFVKVTSTEPTENVSHVVVCLNEIKMGVIAKAAVYPGANTLIMNLLCSFTDEEGEDDLQVTSFFLSSPPPLRRRTAQQVYKNLNGHAIETLDDDEHSDWVGEYRRGCDFEIYMTDLSPEFEGTHVQYQCVRTPDKDALLYVLSAGKTFSTLSELLYRNCGIVLFALEVEDLKNEKRERKVLLNPADFVLPPQSEYKIAVMSMRWLIEYRDLSTSTVRPL